MNKTFLSIMFTLAAITLGGCSSNNRKASSDSTETTISKQKMNINEKEYSALTGTWECIDPDWQGEKVYILKDGKGIDIKYDDRDISKTEFISKSEESEYVYYSFENKKDELGYNIDLLKNGNIILNFGTTNPEMTGLSKPMEYKRIEK